MKSNRSSRLLRATLAASLLLLVTSLLKLILAKRQSQSRAAISEETAPSNTYSPESQGQDTLALKLGARRVMIQLNTFLPQIHLTLISVLQGFALGVLVSRFEKVPPTSIPYILLYIDSLLIVVLIWYLYADVFVVFLWPLSLWHTALQFSLAAAQSVAFFYISQPAIWTLGCGSMALIAAAIRYFNTRLVDPFSYEDQSVYSYDMGLERSAAAMFLLIGIGFGIAGAFQLQFPSQEFTVAVGAATLVVILFLSRMSTSKNKMLIDRYLAHSPWAYWRDQIVNRDDLNKTGSEIGKDAT